MYILKDFCNSVLKIYRRLFAGTEFVTPDILPFDRISVDQCIWKQGENSTKKTWEKQIKIKWQKMDLQFGWFWPQWYTSLKTLSLFKGSIQYSNYSKVKKKLMLWYDFFLFALSVWHVKSSRWRKKYQQQNLYISQFSLLYSLLHFMIWRYHW